jgi:predicted metal-binding membrane protein
VTILLFATEPAHERLRVFAALALAAGLAWLVLALGSDTGALPTICSATLLWSVPSPDTYAYVFAFVSPLNLVIGWAVMVVAMMLPTLYDPLAHVRERSFRRARAWSLTLFSGGYFAVWMLAGVVFLGAALTIRIASPEAGWPLILSAAVASIWQISPWKQVALNRCHRRPGLAAFAPAVFRNAFTLGLQHGFWCLAGCWALMLVPLFAPAHHTAIMAILALGIWAERLEQARAPRWQIRVPLKAMRLASWLLGRWRPSLFG